MFWRKRGKEFITFRDLESVLKELYGSGYPGLYHEEEGRIVYARVVVEEELEWLLQWDGEYSFEVYVWGETGRGKKIGRMYGSEEDHLYWLYGEEAYVKKTIFYLLNAGDIIHRYKRLNIKNLNQEGSVEWKMPDQGRES